MIIIREVFIAKPGSAGKLAKMMKESAPTMGANTKVMLDFVTDYNKIVVEHEVESLAKFEEEMNNYKNKTDPKMAEKMKGYTDLYLIGKREIYKVVE
jgi:hypothetical protein